MKQLCSNRFITSATKKSYNDGLGQVHRSMEESQRFPSVCGWPLEQAYLLHQIDGPALSTIVLRILLLSKARLLWYRILWSKSLWPGITTFGRRNANAIKVEGEVGSTNRLHATWVTSRLQLWQEGQLFKCLSRPQRLVLVGNPCFW